MNESLDILAKIEQFLDNVNGKTNTVKVSKTQQAIAVILMEISKDPEIFEQFDYESIGIIAEAMNGEFVSLFNALKELEENLMVSNDTINKYVDVVQSVAEEMAKKNAESGRLLGVYREIAKSGHEIDRNFIFDLEDCEILSVAPIGVTYIEGWDRDCNLCAVTVQRGDETFYFLCPGDFEDFERLM